MAETSVRTTTGLMGYAAMSFMTAVFTWGVFFWYFAVRALILGGSCGARYGVACVPGTGWNTLMVVVLTPTVCVAVSVLSNEIYGPERRGHEFYRVVLAALPVAALVDLVLYSQDFGFSAWRLVGAILCLALIAIVTVWTIRTTGLRGAFWLMSPSKIVALGTDPALRGLYYSELDVPGIQWPGCCLPPFSGALGRPADRLRLLLVTNLHALRRTEGLESVGVRADGGCVNHFGPQGGYMGVIRACSANSDEEPTFRSFTYSTPSRIRGSGRGLPSGPSFSAAPYSVRMALAIDAMRLGLHQDLRKMRQDFSLATPPSTGARAAANA